MFKLFKSYTFTWQQIGVFKLSLLTIGVLIGAHWSPVILEAQVWLVAVAVLATAYSVSLALRQ